MVEEPAGTPPADTPPPAPPIPAGDPGPLDSVYVGKSAEPTDVSVRIPSNDPGPIATTPVAEGDGGG